MPEAKKLNIIHLHSSGWLKSYNFWGANAYLSKITFKKLPPCDERNDIKLQFWVYLDETKNQ